MDRIASWTEKNSGRLVLAVLACCAVLGWWGALYPRFTMVNGTYRVVGEDGSEREPDGGAVYWKILETDSSRIRFKSRLLTDLDVLQGQTLQRQRRKVYESEDH